MAAGMDGCVSKPAESGPLLNTLRAAVPLHLSPSSPIDGRPLAVESGPNRDGGGGRGGAKVLQGKGLGVLKGSSACAAEGMALAARRDESVEGALQVLTASGSIVANSIYMGLGHQSCYIGVSSNIGFVFRIEAGRSFQSPDY